jgi:N-acetylmuramic acid 6-phosphate etherase
MKSARLPPLVNAPGWHLGIEAGGTHSTVLVVHGQTQAEGCQFQGGPAVLPLLTDRELHAWLREIAARLPELPVAIGIGMAGLRTQADQLRLQRAVAHVWPGVPCLATNDLETALAAAPARREPLPQVLVLSGTGSCCFGRRPDGFTAKVGGRGHVIGDRASACDIGLRALRAAMADLDQRGCFGKLGAAILNALLFTEPEQLIPWSVQAGKKEIADLAQCVFSAAEEGDGLAKSLLKEAARMLAEDACLCAGQLRLEGAELGRVEFVFNGGVILKNPAFQRQVARLIRQQWPGCIITPLKGPSVRGAIALAQIAAAGLGTVAVRRSVARAGAEKKPVLELPAAIADMQLLSASPTEARNPRSLGLDRLSVERGIELMLDEDAVLHPALLGEKARVAKVIRAVAQAFRSGGHLYYVGAGTSGRLGVLDASEIPPTFRAPRGQVQGIIAGGRQALWSAVEGAEDDIQAGAQALKHRQLSERDVVIGIAASGRTPFVWGALHEANACGAFTVLICFNPALRQALRRVREVEWKPRVLICPDTGAEVLTGSTRLKAGTATKLLLNLITTLAMVQVGKVISNLMVDLNPSNVKLRDRAVRILSQLGGCTRQEAQRALTHCGWSVKAAYEQLTKKSQA